MTPREIAIHLLNECTGDNCECCDWPAEERATLDNMTLEEARNLLDNEDEPCEPDNYSDDGEALASAGMGTDEDYGCYSDGDFEPW